MHINLLPLIQNKKNQTDSSHQQKSIQSPSYFNQLNADTVSFSGGTNKVAKNLKTTLKDFTCNSYEKKIPQYKIYSTRLMAALESIALKFKDRGVKFDREYCEHAAVKSTESFISKFIRSGERPLDRIRSTLYIQDPHDFKLLNEILKELEDSFGYEIAKISGTKKPDFDIRLANVTPAEAKALRSDLQDCFSAPAPTGYEDIQFRLKDTTKKSAPPMEVLIIFGDATAKAKIDESKYSYNIRRALKNLLHVAKVKNPEVNTPEFKIKEYIDQICDTLSSSISKPLFQNAKNEDYLHDPKRIPVELGGKTCEYLKGLVESIRDIIPKYYTLEGRKIRSKEYEDEIVKLIKASPMYKDRTDKTVYITDIIEKRKELLSELRHHRFDDQETIIKASEELDATIKKYGPKHPKTSKQAASKS